MQEKKQAIFIADLGFGDAGKGTITDFLARHCAAPLVVRYNGGPQAAHNVVDATGRHHTFSQFGSGTFVPGVRTLLSRFMLLNPLNMLKEARHLDTCGVPDALKLVLFDRRALVITPFQRALNRLREIARGAKRHGSCGEGIGECMADALADEKTALRVGELTERTTLNKKLRLLLAAKAEEFAKLQACLPQTESVRQEGRVFTDPRCIEDCIDVYRFFAQCVEIVDEANIQALFEQTGTLLFEGAQGVLLDENYGFAPYTTWSTTTFANAETLVRENAYAGQILKLGVTRVYATRHGAGPFPSEDPALANLLPEPHNVWNDWQRDFRVGFLDFVATRYARDVVGQLDCLAVTHVDCLAQVPEWRVCTAYHYYGSQQDLADYFQQSGSHITALRVRRPADLEHQEQFTRRLQLCTPVYQTVIPREYVSQASIGHAEYLALIEKQLATPIAITSYGPTAEDKCLHGTLIL